MARDPDVRLRVARRGRDGQVAVGGWDGAVRCFAGGELVTGAIGDLALVPAGLVADSWKRALTLVTAGGVRRELLDAAHRVHWMAVADGSDRFAVVDLSGRVVVYQGEVRVRDWRQFGAVADLAYAGSRLVVLSEGGRTGVRLDGAVDGVEPKPGALRLLPRAAPGTCVLLATADPRRPAAGLEVWSIYQDDRHSLQATFPAGYRLLFTCAVQGRRARLDGGCAYWCDGAEQRVWPDAVDAALTPDGQLAAARPDWVELHTASGLPSADEQRTARLNATSATSANTALQRVSVRVLGGYVPQQIVEFCARAGPQRAVRSERDVVNRALLTDQAS